MAGASGSWIAAVAIDADAQPPKAYHVSASKRPVQRFSHKNLSSALPRLAHLKVVARSIGLPAPMSERCSGPSVCEKHIAFGLS